MTDGEVERLLEAVERLSTPSAILKPELGRTAAGTWIAKYITERDVLLREGACLLRGVGATPALAMRDFDARFHTGLLIEDAPEEDAP